MANVSVISLVHNVISSPTLWYIWKLRIDLHFQNMRLALPLSTALCSHYSVRTLTRNHQPTMACQPRRLLAVVVAVATVLTLATTLLASPSASTNAADSLSFGSSLAGNETLVSNSSVFELGFFTPEGGNGTYLGIWYHGIPGPTIVWVANRHNPVVGSSGGA